MKHCSIRLGVGVIVLLMQAISAGAAEINFYSEAVAVTSQSVAERERAAAAGLANVLVRLSGVADVTAIAAPILIDASRYIDQFQYRRTMDSTGTVVDQLQMSFAPVVIERLLHQVGLPLWPTNRPKILVWLVAEDPKLGRQWVGDSATDIVHGLRLGAAARGVQLRWPTLDLDDQLAINPNDVWAFQAEKILAASERYRVDTVLVGRYLKTPQGQWWTSWQYFHHGEKQFYDLRLEDGLAAGRQAIDPLVNFLAKRYTVTVNSDNPAKSKRVIQVTGVNSFDDFHGVMGALRQIVVISSSQLTVVNGSTLVFNVELTGDEQQLQDSVSIDSPLRFDALQQSSPPLGEATQSPLRFEWIGR